MSPPSTALIGRFARAEGNDNNDVDLKDNDNANTTISLEIGRGGAVVGAAATTTTTVGTAPPPQQWRTTGLLAWDCRITAKQG